MTMEEAVKSLKRLQRVMHAHQHAQGVLSLDAETQAPAGTAEARSETLEILSEEDYRLFVNDRVKETLETVLAHRDETDAQTAREAEVLWEDYRRMTCIPMEEVVAFEVLTNEASAVWHKAKVTSDYALFKPYLAKLIDMSRRFAAYEDASRPAYDVLLNQYEKGCTMQLLDGFFEEIRKGVVPLIDKAKKPRTDFLAREYPVYKQREFSDELMKLMGIDRDHCTISETEHPFTTEFSKYDVRITTHYIPTAIASSLYSVVHEGGHALYELHTGDALQYGCLAEGCSMGLHESQSRLYENMIGRSEAFVSQLYPILRRLFPEQTADTDVKDWYEGVNAVERSLVRTESDELTYSLHIMIRYELEKRLIGGTLGVDELPEAWNAMYKEYLGVDVPDDRHGVLQDSHWSSGSFGYFPSYALGNAYAAQIMARMQRDLDVDAAILAGELCKVNAWLEEHLHRFGKLYDPAEMLRRTTGEDFTPKYYIDYLTRKFG